MPGIGAHTVKAFDEDLQNPRARVAGLGGCEEAALREALHALPRETLGRMRGDPDSIGSATMPLFVARSPRRVTEQGACIARAVRFIVTGRHETAPLVPMVVAAAGRG